MFWKIKDFFREVRCWFRHCFNKQHFKTVWCAFKAHPWDYGFTYDVLRARLVEQYEYFKKSDIGDILGFTGTTNLQNGYSIDHFNYNESILVHEEREESYSLSVIVPIYNNGKQLLGKAFSSLQRSSMFADMEIVLVDPYFLDYILYAPMS